jgi:GNAT superfamily N-acetyltransferase
MMSVFPITFYEIKYLADNLLLPWLDLYEISFSPHEKILVSSFLRNLKQKEQNPDHQTCFLAALDELQELVGMVYYELFSNPKAGLLWYLAISPNRRGSGLGAQFYQEIARRVQVAGCQMLIFEVEKPELMSTDEEQRIASRRIQFYQRQGARLLKGIDYVQMVGPPQPPTPMHLMIQLFTDLHADEVARQAAQIFGDQLQVGIPEYAQIRVSE